MKSHRFVALSAAVALVCACATTGSGNSANSPASSSAPEGQNQNAASALTTDPMLASNTAVSSNGATTAANGYTCPMHPEVHQAGPGQCPQCGMNLVPATGNPDAGTVMNPHANHTH